MSSFHPIEYVQYRDWSFVIRQDPPEGSVRLGGTPVRHYLQVQFVALDKDSSQLEVQSGRKWFLSEHMTDGEIVQTALLAVLAAVEHEAREEFTYKGQPIFGPHYDIEALRILCESHRAFDFRISNVPTPEQLEKFRLGGGDPPVSEDRLTTMPLRSSELPPIDVDVSTGGLG